MPATNDNTIRIRVDLDGKPFKQEAQNVRKEFERVVQQMGISIEKLNQLRGKYNSTIERARQNFERQEISHQRRLELIQERSAKQLLSIETRKLAQLEVSREKAAVKEAQRQARLASQAEAAAKRSSRSFGFGTLTAGAGGLLGGLAIGSAAYGAVQSGFELNETRTTLTAILGTSQKATEKMTELRKLVKESVGLTQQVAIESYSVFKTAGNLADETIDKILKSIGKLNAAFKIDDVRQFSRNLLQIFNNFDKQDITQALDRIPIFNTLLKQAFGTSDPEKLRELKKAGKLTIEGYFTGMSEAINNNPILKNIQDNLRSQTQKSLDDTKQKIAELGEKILTKMIPVLNQLLPIVNKVLDFFSNLPIGLQSTAFAVALLPSPLSNLAGSIAKVSKELVGLNAASAGGGLSRLLAFIGSPFGAFLTVGALAAGGVYLSYNELQKRTQAMEYNRKIQETPTNFEGNRVFPDVDFSKVQPLKDGFKIGTKKVGEFNDLGMLVVPQGKDTLTNDTKTKITQEQRADARFNVRLAVAKAQLERQNAFLENAEREGNVIAAYYQKLSDITEKINNAINNTGAAAGSMLSRGFGQLVTGNRRGFSDDQRDANRAYQNKLDRIDDLVSSGAIDPVQAEQLRRAAALSQSGVLGGIAGTYNNRPGIDRDDIQNLREEAEHMQRLSVATSEAQRFLRGFKSEVRSLGDSFETLGQNISSAFSDVSTLLTSLKNSFLSFVRDVAGSALRSIAGSVLGPLAGKLGSVGSIGIGGTAPTFPNNIAKALSTVGFGNGFGVAGTSLGALDTFSGISQINSGASQILTGSAGKIGGLSGIFGRLKSSLKSTFSSPLSAGALGASLGGLLGGSSKLGQGLGMGGGALVSAGLGGLITGSMSLAVAGPLAAIGVPLLIGSIFAGRAAQRRRDEPAADAAWVQYSETLKALTRDVKANRLDGDSALAQAASARQEAVNQINSLKTKSVRESRLRNQIPQIDAHDLANLRSAVSQQNARRELSSKLVPEFASGGVVPGQIGEARYVLAHGRELIVNPAQQTPQLMREAERAGVPGVGGRSASGSTGQPVINVVYEIGTESQDRLFINGVESPRTDKAIKDKINKLSRYHEIR